MKMLLDLLGLMFMRASSMFSWSFLSSRTVQALVVVSVVRRQPQARSYSLSANHPSRGPDDHFHGHGEGQRGDGAAGHDSHFQMLPCCGVLGCYQAELDILEVGLDKGCEGSWDLEVVEGCPQKVVRDWAKGVSKSRKTTWRSVPSFLATWIWCQLTLACSTQPEKPEMPAFCIDVSIRLFLCRYPASLWATTLKKIFPSLEGWFF